MALQHQTTQRSPAEEHFGDARECRRCKRPATRALFSQPHLSVTSSPQDPQMLDQLAKNITRCGLSNSTLNYLRVSGLRCQSVVKSTRLPELILSLCPLLALKLCVILEPMQELMSRHKTYSLSPRDCLKTCLFQKWQRMVAPPGPTLIFSSF